MKYRPNIYLPVQTPYTESHLDFSPQLFRLLSTSCPAVVMLNVLKTECAHGRPELVVLCRGWINVGIVCWVNTCGLFRLFCTGRKCTDLQWIVGAFQRVQVLLLGGCWFTQRQRLKSLYYNHKVYWCYFKLYLQQSPFLTIFTYLLTINLKGNSLKKIITFQSQDDKH